MIKIMEYSEALNYLNTYTKSGKPIKDLSRFRGLMNVLDNVQDNLKYIHIAGTNGKGSVSEYAALALEYRGFKTGKFTSPYINKIEERIQINGAPISEMSPCPVPCGKSFMSIAIAPHHPHHSYLMRIGQASFQIPPLP